MPVAPGALRLARHPRRTPEIPAQQLFFLLWQYFFTSQALEPKGGQDNP
jgi:hypothetical protein